MVGWSDGRMVGWLDGWLLLVVNCEFHTLGWVVCVVSVCYLHISTITIIFE